MALKTVTDGTDRTPLRWTSYSADVTDTIVSAVLGPNALGEYLTVVEATYDPDTGVTRAGFVYSTQAEVLAELERRLLEETPYGKGPTS